MLGIRAGRGDGCVVDQRREFDDRRDRRRLCRRRILEPQSLRYDCFGRVIGRFPGVSK